MTLKKLYLDTSVISHLDAPDVPEKTRDTKKLWEYFIENRYEIVLSNVTLDEIMKCSDPKKTNMLNYLTKIKYSKVTDNEISDKLVNRYLKYGILTDKSIDDLRHIALAVTYECDIIISWNFKHLVNYKVMNKLKEVNRILGYNEISIISPTMLLDEEDQLFDPIIDYIHQIRYENYEKTKNLSLQELIEKTNQGAQKTIEEIERMRKR